MRFFRLTPAEQLLRIALAFAFIYPPISAVFDPYSWVGYFPTFLSDAVAPHQAVLLHAFGILEIGLALWVLLAARVRTPALIMAAFLLVIVAANPAQFDVLFRDVALAFCALSLALRRAPSRAA